MDRQEREKSTGEGWEQKIRKAEHEREFKKRMRVRERERDKKMYRMEKRGGKRGRLQAFVMRTKRATMITQQHNM